jgi:hypothetical protein
VNIHKHTHTHITTHHDLSPTMPFLLRFWSFSNYSTVHLVWFLQHLQQKEASK